MPIGGQLECRKNTGRLDGICGNMAVAVCLVASFSMGLLVNW